MIKNYKEYSYCICNWLNNLKGYIEDYEIYNLMWCMFGLEDDSFDKDLITQDDIDTLSSYVSCDNEDKFFEKILEIYNRIKGIK